MASQDSVNQVSQGSFPRVAQETPKEFIPKPRKPRMDARTYKKLFIRREVQVFKTLDDQEPQESQKVVQVIKVQGVQEFQEEVGQNFWIFFFFYLL